MKEIFSYLILIAISMFVILLTGLVWNYVKSGKLSKILKKIGEFIGDVIGDVIGALI